MGYVEPGIEPIEQAWTEIREELGLQAPDVWLVRSGPSLPLTSPASSKQFLVYPFLFESAQGSQVTLNWEHSEVAWVEPSRLDKADCVPRGQLSPRLAPNSESPPSVPVSSRVKR